MKWRGAHHFALLSGLRRKSGKLNAAHQKKAHVRKL